MLPSRLEHLEHYKILDVLSCGLDTLRSCHLKISSDLNLVCLSFFLCLGHDFSSFLFCFRYDICSLRFGFGKKCLAFLTGPRYRACLSVLAICSAYIKILILIVFNFKSSKFTHFAFHYKLSSVLCGNFVPKVGTFDLKVRSVAKTEPKKLVTEVLKLQPPAVSNLVAPLVHCLAPMLVDSIYSALIVLVFILLEAAFFSDIRRHERLH